MGKLWGMLARICLGGTIVALGCALGAAPASASAAYTGDASPGETSATAYGYVAPRGQTTSWTFLYGTSAQYDQSSKLGTIAAGDTTVLVAAQLAGLRDDTTYHFALLAVPYDSSGNPDWANASVGQDATFTTTKGNLNLLSSRLVARHGAVSIPVQCASALRCAGKLSLDTRSGGRSIHCATARLSLTAEARSNLTARLNCLRLIRSATGHRITATVTGNLPTGQAPPSQTVTLSG